MKKGTTNKLTLNVRRKRVEIRTNVNTGKVLQAGPPPKSRYPMLCPTSMSTLGEG